MEYLINSQTRERHPGQENLDKYGGPKERRIPPQKTSTFKGEKRRPRGWLQRMFSEESTNGYDSNGVDQAVAVAAAAQAIVSLTNRPDIPVHRKIREGPPEPTTRQISGKREGKKTISILEPGESSTRTTGSSIPTSTSVPEIVSMGEDDDATLVKTARPTPSKRIASTASLDNQITNGPGVATRDINTQARGSLGYVPTTDEVHTPKPEMKDSGLGSPITRKSAMQIEVPKLDLPPPPLMKRQGSTVIAGSEELKTDTWQRTQLDKIKKKYDELNNKINSWENKKKAKAKRRLDKTESELERTRLKATNKYRRETSDINNMAAAARAQATERQRNEEFKLKSKANKIRTKGKVSRKTCFCF